MNPLRDGFVSMFALVFALPLLGQEKKDDFFKPADANKPVAGKSEMLRPIPKKYATLQAFDAAKREVTLLVEGEKEPRTWPLLADAELKYDGWWARLHHFNTGRRVWVWFDVDRKKQPRGILMMADEISQQDINDTPPTLEAANVAEQTVTLKPTKGASRTLKLADGLKLERDGERFRLLSTGGKGGPDTLVQGLKIGDKVFAQTANDTLTFLLDPAGLELWRGVQKRRLRSSWESEGLPGAVTFLHRLGGEMEFTLEHEAIRWGRSLQTGDKVRLSTPEPIEAVVKHVVPWRERTQIRLVVDGFSQAELTLGQRLFLRMKAPPASVDESVYPPDIDRPRTKADRVEWFLASIYCPCKVRGDGCTGMFYTLASCNINACGLPNHVREQVGELIDKGLNDRQIFDQLHAKYGTSMLKPHLMP